MPRTTCKKSSPRTRKGGAPTENATCWTVGSTKKGTDGRTYEVIKAGTSRRWQARKSKSTSNAGRKSPTGAGKSPRGTKSKSADATLFAFYDRGESSRDWPAMKLPRTWRVAGSGSTHNQSFPGETQFGGQRGELTRARAEIAKTLDSMKRAGDVVRFKVRSSYLP